MPLPGPACTASPGAPWGWPYLELLESDAQTFVRLLTDSKEENNTDVFSRSLSILITLLAYILIPLPLSSLTNAHRTCSSPSALQKKGNNLLNLSLLCPNNDISLHQD